LTSYFFRAERQLINHAEPGGDSLLTTAGSLPIEAHNVGRIAARRDDVRINVPIQIAESNSIHRSLPITEAYLLEAAPTAIVEENRARRGDISNDDVRFSIAIQIARRRCARRRRKPGSVTAVINDPRIIRVPSANHANPREWA